ncbi:MAG: sigma-70 family RNA polymerase sigma factor [Planctomycetota bacterium]
MDAPPDHVDRLALSGEPAGLEQALIGVRPRVARMVALRLDLRLRGRLDASDVLQEAFIEVHARIGEWRARNDLPFFIWVRFLVGQKLAQLHRRHLGTEARDVRREVALALGGSPAASSVTLASALVSGGLSPSGVAMRAEQEARLAAALDDLRPIDREVLAMRHFEGLSNAEVATALGLEPATASKRYLRALTRLQELVRPRSGR